MDTVLKNTLPLSSENLQKMQTVNSNATLLHTLRVIQTQITLYSSTKWKPEEKTSEWFMQEKLNYKYHIMFVTNIAFNVAALCTTSVLQFLLSCQMKQES